MVNFVVFSFNHTTDTLLIHVKLNLAVTSSLLLSESNCQLFEISYESILKVSEAAREISHTSGRGRPELVLPAI